MGLGGRVPKAELEPGCSCGGVRQKATPESFNFHDHTQRRIVMVEIGYHLS